MKYKLYLGSGSVRRVELLQQMGIEFKQRIINIDEVYPDKLNGVEITNYLAKKKGLKHQKNLKDHEVVLTADTIVWFKKTALGKPQDSDEAIEMLKFLSGNAHDVISSVCLSTNNTQSCIQEITKVFLKDLSREEIAHYVKLYQPFDKAGAYGIQEWIGLIGVLKIIGSYTNVVGLPTEKTYKLLRPYLF
jgi:septum formation protein